METKINTLRKAILVEIFLLLSICSFSQSSGTGQVVFGRHGGQDQSCVSGRGVCSFSISDKETFDSTDLVFRKISENSFALKFNIKTINPEDQISIAGKRFGEVDLNGILFMQEADIYLNEQTTKFLGFDKRYNKVTKGNYRMVTTKEELEIIFTLKTSD